MQAPHTAEAFIQRWQGVSASELATAQSFVMDLCELLGVAKPHPTPAQDHMFERPVTFTHGDGSSSAGRIDCYKRGHFVLEAKKLKAGAHTKGFDDGLLRARSQGEHYARALPAAEGRPPFVLVVDVGTVIEVYAEFSRSGGTYTPFPDPRSHRIALADLAQPAVRERLRLIWTQPEQLNPALISAQVTREVSQQLALLARSLEQAGHPPHGVAAYLSRCLFSMFAEDVELLPKGAFQALLEQHRQHPHTVQQMLRILWADMDRGGFSAALVQPVLQFNGKLFKGADADSYSLPLTTAQIDLLIAAAQANWREVEPAIFGTLLERALDPDERHALGAHYTPRAYVERLVLPTVIEPLRAEWANAQAAALTLAHEAAELEAQPPTVNSKKDFAALDRHHAAVRAKWKDARQQVKDFLHRLCTLRVLDPACGSANFLYVTLEHLKRLEGEVLNQLGALGDTQDALDLGRETVTVAQLRGIELNERAAALAELVLWIGFLQWHIRTHGNAAVAEPVVHNYGNIECRDAVLAHDGTEPLTDANGQVQTRWDGVSTQPHPVTGQPVPNEAARVPQWRYLNPRQAAWPQADFIVGNPPFIGASTMRAALGDGYVDALREVWPDVPDSADFVMYWWARSAALVGAGAVERMGLITTNSLRQTFNRRVVQAALAGELSRSLRPVSSAGASADGLAAGGLAGTGAGNAGGLMLPNAQKSAPGLPHPGAGAVHLAFAVPDHPWVDSANGAAVRIAMTVAAPGNGDGSLWTVQRESAGQDGEVTVALAERKGLLHADLSVGANVAATKPLQANGLISNTGVKLHGAGFIVTRTEAAALGLGHVPGLERHIREYRNGRDLTSTPRDVLVIDLFGLDADEVRNRFPAVYQWVWERVKPERDLNREEYRRTNWWLFGRKNTELRSGLRSLPRYIATVETAKHRVFQFLDASILPDNKLIAIALDDACHLGVLSSQVHGAWALAAGSWLGVGNDPVYVKSRCFETFPFPDADTGLTPERAGRIRALAEQIDAHRKKVLGQSGADGADLVSAASMRPQPSSAAPAPSTTPTPTPTPQTLTLTALYNVLEKLRSGEALTAKEKAVHEQGLVGVLRSLHDELDATVLAAYGWAYLPLRATPADPATTDALLQRLVDLNARRAAEEAAGTVRWLRPGFQQGAGQGEQTALDMPPDDSAVLGVQDSPGWSGHGAEAGTGSGHKAGTAGKVGKRGDATARGASGQPGPVAGQRPWPSGLPEQIKAVAEVLASTGHSLDLDALATHFSGRGRWRDRLPTLLDTLAALGRIRAQEGGRWQAV